MIITAVKLLNDLCNVLGQIKSNLKTENILQADTNYIRNQMAKNDSYRYEKFPMYFDHVLYVKLQL